MNLTAAMIIRNEAEYLEECLQSIHSVSDQIVIVDTGSTDSSLEIARKYNAEIHHFKWIDDFAAARNESLRFAKGNWVLCIDADERLETASVEELRKITESSDFSSFYKVRIRNQTREQNHFNITSTHRLFPNHHGIVFDGIIHEQITASAMSNGLKEKKSQITLNHLGYVSNEKRNTAKSHRNYKLLQKYVAQRPNDAYAHFTFAQHLDLSGEIESAYRHYRTAAKLDQFNPPAKATLLNALANVSIKLKQFSRALSYCEESLAIVPRQVSACYQLYKIGILNNDEPLAIDGLERLEEVGFYNAKFFSELPSDLQIDKQQVVYTLAVLYQKQENYNAILQLYSRLQDSIPFNEQNYRQLINSALKLDRVSLACDYLEILRQKYGLAIADLQILAMLYIKRKEFQRAIEIYSSILQMEPTNQDAIKKLAGLYAATGCNDIASDLLNQLS